MTTKTESMEQRILEAAEKHRLCWTPTGMEPHKNGAYAHSVWDGQSRGTGYMIDTSRKRGLKVFVYRTDQSCQSVHDTRVGQ